MTNKEAINVLKNMAFMLHDGLQYVKEDYEKMFREAYEMGFHALELLDRTSGHWIHRNDDHLDWLECSSCGYGDEGENDVEWNYCPICGARMKKEARS